MLDLISYMLGKNKDGSGGGEADHSMEDALEDYTVDGTITGELDMSKI